MAAQVVTFDMSGSGAVIGVGHATDVGTDGEGGNDESRERGVEIAWPVPPRWVRMEGVS